MKNYQKPTTDVIEIEFEAYCLNDSTTSTDVDLDNPLTPEEEYNG